MPVRTPKRKDPAAVALGRKGGKKGGVARAAKLTPAQRSESARKAVRVRWAKAQPVATETSDKALLALLKQLKVATARSEIRRLSSEIERVIFHKQYKAISKQ